MKLLVTGVLGFIGSHFVKWCLDNYPDIEIRGFNRDSDQRSYLRLNGYHDHPRFRLIYGDLAKDVSGLCEHIDCVVNFAAKTFVDHSIKDAGPFIKSNIVGVYNLLEEARRNKVGLFCQVSTDEVYGSILEGAYKEDAVLNPSNPYASTKAAADLLVIAYHNTYGLKYIITRTENNYGSYQHPQKAIPTFVRCALENKPLPVYGDGHHRRMWLRVEDHCRAILHLILTGDKGLFHVAGSQELENIELAKRILRILGKPEDLIELVPDMDIRPGHDRRYALNTDKIRKAGWVPRWDLENGLPKVILWYKENQWWLKG